MKKLKKHKLLRSKSDFFSGNRLVIAAIGGAAIGLAVTYLLKSEKGKALLNQVTNSVKTMVAKIELPALKQA